MEFPFVRWSIPFAALVLAHGATPAWAQRTRPIRETPQATRVQSFDDPASFTGTEARIDFEDMALGSAIQDQYASRGVRILSPETHTPAVWLDTFSTRISGPGGEHALWNREDARRIARPGEDPDARMRSGLTLQFRKTITRVGFELRSSRDEALNLVVLTFRKGEPQGHSFFDIGAAYGFVGVETSLPIDEIQLVFTNPSDSVFSLDNLAFELDRTDSDLDGTPDFADVCPDFFNPEQRDSDHDGIGDACDPYPLDARNDADGDGFGALEDNCPDIFNPGQEDADGDGTGDPCDTYLFGDDSDGDGVPDDSDNCPDTFNPNQEDCDEDGIGDTCDPETVAPAVINAELLPGEFIVVDEEACLLSAPPMVDLVIGMDVTGSMGGEINTLKENMARFANQVRQATSSDLVFGLVSHKDYPGSYNACGYGASYGGGADFPFRVDAPVGSSDLQVAQAILALGASGGSDGPESYTRVLWEMGQPDSGINLRPGAARLLVMAGDWQPHDCDISSGLVDCFAGSSTGVDPGRDGILFTEDDLDLQDDALPALLASNTKLMVIHSGFYTCAWQQWAEQTGGTAVQINGDGSVPSDIYLDQIALELLGDPIVDLVEFVPDPDCPVDISFDPPFIVGPIDATLGAKVETTATILAPTDLPAGLGDVTCSIRVLADGVEVGSQTLNLSLPCGGLGFEGPANGQRVGLGLFNSLGVHVSGGGPHTYGPAIFDSSPEGPNAFGPDPDLLVDLGNILILQESNAQTVPGIYDTPDDAQLGGQIVFDFDDPSELLSIDLVDIDVGPPLQTVDLRLIDGAGNARTYHVPDGWTDDVFLGGVGYRTLDLTTLAGQPGESSTATASEDAGFDPTDVVQLVIDLSSSGALDNLVFCE